MSSYWVEWLALLLRWAHLVVGIAWIGSSFYFMWLDAQLNRPPLNPENDRVGGDLWAVHGGGFYHAQKYTVAPAEIPEPLHWFKWEAYTTWLTGFSLLLVTYYWNAELYLVDASVLEMSGTTAVTVSMLLLAAGWLAYDLLCRSGLSDRWVAILGFAGLCAAVFGMSKVFGGRGLYMQTGAMLGTIMAANVLMVIIPGQRKMVAAVEAGVDPDPAPGLKAKQRSTHNNYLTLPVLFVMLSNHYPMTFGHSGHWLILLALFVVGGTVRHYFNLRNVGRHRPLLPAAAVLGVVAVAYVTAPKPSPVKQDVIQTDSSTPVDAAVEPLSIAAVIDRRCRACHSATPTHPTAPIAPKGVRLDTPEEAVARADQIYDMTVVNRTMPLANLTQMTEDERDVVAAWYVGLTSSNE